MKYVLYTLGFGILVSVFLLGDQVWDALDQFIAFVKTFLP